MSRRAPLVWRVVDKRRFRGSSRLHRMLQVLVADWLSMQGFDVYIEEPLVNGLVADIYAESPWTSVIVEVETGFIDPRNLEQAEDYLAMKVASKAAKYSSHADLFVMAHPSYLRIPIPPELAKSRGPPKVDALLEIMIARKLVRVTPLSELGSALLMIND